MFIFSKKHSWLTGKTKFKNVPNSITMTRAGHTSQQSDTVLGFNVYLLANYRWTFCWNSILTQKCKHRIYRVSEAVVTLSQHIKTIASPALQLSHTMLIFKLKAACRQNSFRNSLMSFTYCTYVQILNIQLSKISYLKDFISLYVLNTVWIEIFYPTSKGSSHQIVLD